MPVERDAHSRPVVYDTLNEAQRQVAEYTIERLQQFLAGEREYDDAMTVEEYIVEVDALCDGSIVDEDDNVFGPGDCLSSTAFNS